MLSGNAKADLGVDKQQESFKKKTHDLQTTSPANQNTVAPYTGFIPQHERDRGVKEGNMSLWYYITVTVHAKAWNNT